MNICDLTRCMYMHVYVYVYGLAVFVSVCVSPAYVSASWPVWVHLCMRL